MLPGLAFIPGRNVSSVFHFPSTSFFAVYSNNNANLSPRNINRPVSWRNVKAPLSAISTSSSSSRIPRRTYSSKSDKPSNENSLNGPNQDRLPHVSEEAAAVDKIIGKTCDGGSPSTPELEQGTPIDEVSTLELHAPRHGRNNYSCCLPDPSA
jgi:hypothetical protein